MVDVDRMAFVTDDAQGFESLGFHVLGTALHVGAAALRDPRASDIPTHEQTRCRSVRCGVVQWLQSVNALPGAAAGLTILGIGVGLKSDMYPLITSKKAFLPQLKDILVPAMARGDPVFIRCGRLCPFDYVFLYPRRASTGMECVPVICDAKHTKQSQGKGEAVTVEDQEQLLEGTLSFVAACNEAQILLAKDAKLFFLTNRKTLATERRPSTEQRKSLDDSLREVQGKFPGVTLELLNEATFELLPFTRILFARANY
jgi:hypothetical protein